MQIIVYSIEVLPKLKSSNSLTGEIAEVNPINYKTINFFGQISLLIGLNADDWQLFMPQSKTKD